LGKMLLDFLPVVLFFVVYKFYDNPTEGIVAATGAAIVASIIQVTYTRIRYGKVENMHLVTLVLIVVLGGLTIAFKDETFIKWKPSIVNWAFALAFIGAPLFTGKNLVQRMMEGAVTLPPKIWRGLNLAWIIFFIAIGLLNIYVAYNYDTDTWVNFKLFGMLGITVVFVIGQSLILTRFMENEPTEDSGDES
jgi:intracellular septation protein